MVIRIPQGLLGLHPIQGLSLGVAPCFLILGTKSKELFKRERGKEKRWRVEAVNLLEISEELLGAGVGGGLVALSHPNPAEGVMPRMITGCVTQGSSFLPDALKEDQNEKMGQACVSQQGLSMWWFDLCPSVSHSGTSQFSWGCCFQKQNVAAQGGSGKCWERLHSRALGLCRGPAFSQGWGWRSLAPQTRLAQTLEGRV